MYKCGNESTLLNALFEFKLIRRLSDTFIIVMHRDIFSLIEHQAVHEIVKEREIERS